MQWIHKIKIHPKMIYNRYRSSFNKHFIFSFFSMEFSYTLILSLFFRPPLNCQKCQFRFFTDQGLERHLLGSHGLVTSSMQEAANKSKDSGRCPVCGRVGFQYYSILSFFVWFLHLIVQIPYLHHFRLVSASHCVVTIYTLDKLYIIRKSSQFGISRKHLRGANSKIWAVLEISRKTSVGANSNVDTFVNFWRNVRWKRSVTCDTSGNLRENVWWELIPKSGRYR